MSFTQSFTEVLKEAKKAFEGIERSYYEKQMNKQELKATFKEVGFVNGTRKILVYR